MVMGQTELLVILLILLLLFGSTKLPELARSMGRAKKEFKEGMADEETGKEAEAKAPAEAPKPAEAAPAEPKAEAPAEEEKKPAASE